MAVKTRIMVVDDDETIIDTLTFNFKRAGYEVISFNRAMEALAGFNDAKPDLVMLDWMMPDMKGPDLCALLREQAPEMPILMLTGRSTPNDIAHGLSSGADDYLVKPFSLVELMARIEALLRRSGKGRKFKPLSSGPIVLGTLTLDDEARRVTYEGRNIDLSPREFNLLRVLMINVGKVLTTESLLDKVWGTDFDGDVKTVAVHMRWLRQKLESDPKCPKLLETVHRSGYRLNNPADMAK
ncbi:MAG: response regulator transcription factor [Candidatus Obscuribacter sp.]|nr:response regulator transcription factor [Candidatus Obscuribacter sp.]MBK9278955.1 response regulator transcription factor [Candidatus Obscuribacter sp.]